MGRHVREDVEVDAVSEDQSDHGSPAEPTGPSEDAERSPEDAEADEQDSTAEGAEA